MAPSTAVVRIGAAIAALVAVAAGAGLFARGGPGSHEVISARGQPTQLYGMTVVAAALLVRLLRGVPGECRTKDPSPAAPAA